MMKCVNCTELRTVTVCAVWPHWWEGVYKTICCVHACAYTLQKNIVILTIPFVTRIANVD